MAGSPQAGGSIVFLPCHHGISAEQDSREHVRSSSRRVPAGTIALLLCGYCERVSGGGPCGLSGVTLTINNTTTSIPDTWSRAGTRTKRPSRHSPRRKIPPTLRPATSGFSPPCSASTSRSSASSFLRVLFGIPMVLFIPGYALIAALFPGKRISTASNGYALSFGLSIAVVPLTGLVLNYTPWGIRLDPIVMSLAILYHRPLPHRPVPQGAAGAGGALCRSAGDEIKKSLSLEFFPEESSRTDRILSVILLIAIVARGRNNGLCDRCPQGRRKIHGIFHPRGEGKGRGLPVPDSWWGRTRPSSSGLATTSTGTSATR